MGKIMFLSNMSIFEEQGMLSKELLAPKVLLISHWPELSHTRKPNTGGRKGGWITQINRTMKGQDDGFGEQPNMYVSDDLNDWGISYQGWPLPISTAWFSLFTLLFLWEFWLSSPHTAHGPWPRQGFFGPNLISPPNSSSRPSSECISQERLMAVQRSLKSQCLQMITFYLFFFFFYGLACGIWKFLG